MINKEKSIFKIFFILNNYKKLSDKYKNGKNKQLTPEEVDAYITARMPATYAAIDRVFQNIPDEIAPNLHTMSDYGAGPGTGLLVAKKHFPIQAATLYEKNQSMVSKGKQLVDAQWVIEDFTQVNPLQSDLALFSYSLGELPPERWQAIIESVWNQSQVIVAIEPGTPDGYELIMQIRDLLLRLGGHLLAPCPHERGCPLRGLDWCHFSARLARTKEHRLVKGAKRGWEDEKFSYIIATHSKNNLPKGRIIRHPQKNKGHVVLKVCDQDGVSEQIITPKKGPFYKWARKADWGDSTDL